MKPVRFLEPAQVEAEEAVAYFDSRREGLGDRFEHELEHTTGLIQERPLIGYRLTRRVRKLRLRKFSYNVIYVIANDEIVIVAVAHHKRRPGYWRGRVSRVKQ